MLFYQSGRRSRHPRAPLTGKASTLSCEFLLFSRTNSRSLGDYARNAGGPFAARKFAAPIAGPGAQVPVGTRFPCSIVLDWGAFMSLRVRCHSCRTAFLTPIDQPDATVECPKCGAHHRLPQSAEPVDTPQPQAPSALASTPSASVFVASSESQARSSRRRWFVGLAGLAVVVLAGLAALVLWPRLKPHRSIRSSVLLRSTCNRSSRAMKPPSAG